MMSQVDIQISLKVLLVNNRNFHLYLDTLEERRAETSMIQKPKSNFKKSRKRKNGTKSRISPSSSKGTSDFNFIMK